MKEKIKVGYIGVGRRGTVVLQRAPSQMTDVEIVYICDLCQEKIDNAIEIVKKNGGYSPKGTTDYKTVLNDKEIDAVFIMTGWSGRVDIVIDAMNAGKYAAFEVGCADSLDECYRLVEAYEKTRVPCMMLENGAYDRRKMMLWNMHTRKLFGDIVYCTGGYMHYLNDVDLYKEVDEKTATVPHYRLGHYINSNSENYPTHAIGPLLKLLKVNRGNRILSLSSIGSESRGLKSYSERRFGKDSGFASIDYKQSDIMTTHMKCENGELVASILDTTLPRAYYSQNINIRGTEGMFNEDRRVVFLEGMAEPVENNENEFYEKYEHPLWKEYLEKGIKEGHGGVDYLVCRAFVEAVKNRTDTPIDAYDSATWLAIGPLSKLSLEKGGTSVEFPDFTNGKYKNRETHLKTKYSLDEIVEDLDTPIY